MVVFRYENNIECDWLLRVHPLERIQIKFTLFDLEAHTRCRFDYLELRDGDNSESPLINRFCGREIPRPVVSTGNKVWVKFRADSTFTGQGFRAEYVRKLLFFKILILSVSANICFFFFLYSKHCVEVFTQVSYF
jgi:hypothetical protein